MTDETEKLLIFNRLQRLLHSCYIYGDGEGCVYLDVENRQRGTAEKIDTEKVATEIKNALWQIRDFGEGNR